MLESEGAVCGWSCEGRSGESRGDHGVGEVGGRQGPRTVCVYGGGALGTGGKPAVGMPGRWRVLQDQGLKWTCSFPAPFPVPLLPAAALANCLQRTQAPRCRLCPYPHTQLRVKEVLGWRLEVGAFGLSFCRRFYSGWMGSTADK